MWTHPSQSDTQLCLKHLVISGGYPYQIIAVDSVQLAPIVGRIYLHHFGGLLRKNVIV